MIAKIKHFLTTLVENDAGHSENDYMLSITALL